MYFAGYPGTSEQAVIEATAREHRSGRSTRLVRNGSGGAGSDWKQVGIVSELSHAVSSYILYGLKRNL